MNRRIHLFILLLIIAGCGRSLQSSAPRFFYPLRAYFPYPFDYVHRLRMLGGWTGQSLNCSGFICNAHHSPFRKSFDFYENTFGDLELLGTAIDSDHIQEANLQPGDIAAFRGPFERVNHGHDGVHVAAYIGGGVWIDEDGRRGNAREFRMQSVFYDDLYFMGDVRLYRWKNGPKMSLVNLAACVGKDDRSEETE